MRRLGNKLFLLDSLLSWDTVKASWLERYLIHWQNVDYSHCFSSASVQLMVSFSSLLSNLQCTLPGLELQSDNTLTQYLTACAISGHLLSGMHRADFRQFFLIGNSSNLILDLRLKCSNTFSTSTLKFWILILK